MDVVEGLGNELLGLGEPVCAGSTTFFTITAGPGTAVMTAFDCTPVRWMSVRIASTTGASSWMTFDWMTVGGSGAVASAVSRGPDGP